MSVEYVVQEKTVYEVLEVHEDGEKCFVMADFESESEADEYKEQCEQAEE